MATLGGVHPIEHLRFLVREADDDPGWVVPEAAEALQGLIGDRNGLVMAARMLLEHLPWCGPLWWLCGHVLTAIDPRGALEACVDQFVDDTTALQVSFALGDLNAAEPAPRIVTTVFVGVQGFVPLEHRSVRSSPLVEKVGGPLWLVAGVGTVAPVQVIDAALRRCGDVSPLVSLDDVDRVVRPTGATGVGVLRSRPDIPWVPELAARP